MKLHFVYLLCLVISLPVCSQPVVRNGTKAIFKISKPSTWGKGLLRPFGPAAPISGAAAKVTAREGASISREIQAALEKVTTSNTLSRKQLRQAALQMRENRVKEKWAVMPKPQAAETHEFALGGNGAILTKLTPTQAEQAEKRWIEAVESIQELSAQMGPQIYYLGTAEAEYLPPGQIRLMLDKISQTLASVEKAQVIWGKTSALSEMEIYLLKAQKFYSMMGSGMYEPLDEITVPVMTRKDDHVYNASEFHLWAESFREKLPIGSHKLSWQYVKALFTASTSRSVLPQKLHVALLQDDASVIHALKEMKQRGRLDGWEIDYLKPDPEIFLNSDYKTYDLILTDIVMTNGGGRYLARNLRANGYEGALVAVSKYSYYPKYFFDDGFDGGISISDGNLDLANWIWSRLKNYYFLKQKYGWSH